MITIRYASLPEGLHARAEAHGRRTVIYLRPGLTVEQRRRSLRRARQSARMGYGPRLSGPGVALAVARHVSAVTVWNLGAAVRRHPVGFLLLSAAFAMLVACYALFVTVSIRLMPPPPRPPPAAPGPLPARVLPAAGVPGRGVPPGPAAVAPRHPRDATDRPRAAAGKDRRVPGPGRTGPATPSPSPSTSPAPAPRPAPSPSPGLPGPGVCVTVGPFGVCL
jgi:hypothetical protein